MGGEKLETLDKRGDVLSLLWEIILHFFFVSIADWDSIFHSGPCFMGAQGLYLDQRRSDFNPNNDVPTIDPIWVNISFLPLHCWNKATFRNIGNTLGKYIDHAKTHEGSLSCAYTCVEVDLDKVLMVAINLNLDNWCHI